VTFAGCGSTLFLVAGVAFAGEKDHEGHSAAAMTMHPKSLVHFPQLR
jgi:hypothetical protein